MNRYPIYSIIDIETAPAPMHEALLLAPEFKAPSNYRDPVKIEAAILEARLSWLDDAALSPVSGRICAIGWVEEEGDPTTLTSVGSSETALIACLWSYLMTANQQRMFITFFGNGFDWPFLIRRSWALGLDVPPWVMDNRGYLSDRFIDLAKIWSCGNRQDTISLDRLSRFLKTGEKNGDGKHFHELLDHFSGHGEMNLAMVVQ